MKGIADYVFERPLGEGTQGKVFLARAPSRLALDDPHVAVKVLRLSAAGDELRRFARELRAFAGVQSDYLVRLHDAGQDGTALFYAMQYHERGSLAGPAEPLTPRVVVAAVADAARAAHDLHEAGMAHRGIKPSNVLLSSDDGARLADLSLAQTLSPGQTVTTMGGMESVEYTDPAVLRGGRAGRASDIWSLGCTLHAALTGRSVYPGLPGSDPIVALRHLLSHPPAIDASVDGALREVIGACLAEDPADRPVTAGELSEILDETVETEET